MVAINYKDLRKQMQLDGPRRPIQFIGQLLREHQLSPGDFSLRQLAQHLIPDGFEFVETLDPRYGGGINLLEANDVVDTSAFRNITGQIVYTTILEEYQRPDFLWPKLCTVIPTRFNGEKVPGVSGLGDASEPVDEAKPYPTVGVSSDYIETPETTKHGLIVPITKEAIFFDITGRVIERCRQVGEALGLRREKAVIDLATGQTNNWNRNGTAYNTYAATGGHGQVNQIVNILADWTDIDAAFQAFDGLTDWVTGEPIAIGATPSMLVPRALQPTANMIKTATQVRTGASAATTYQTIGGNPLAGQQGFEILSNAYVYSRTSSNVQWFIGDPKKAFSYMENWPVAVVQSPPNSEAEFSRDIVAQFKASERGVAAVRDPLYMVKSTGTT